nr:hypothetical protein [Providencia rettgeri]
MADTTNVLMARVRRQVLENENVNRGISVSKNGGVSRDPNVVLQDANVQRLLRLIRENNRTTSS